MILRRRGSDISSVESSTEFELQLERTWEAWEGQPPAVLYLSSILVNVSTSIALIMVVVRLPMVSTSYNCRSARVWINCTIPIGQVLNAPQICTKPSVIMYTQLVLRARGIKHSQSVVIGKQTAISVHSVKPGSDSWACSWFCRNSESLRIILAFSQSTKQPLLLIS